MMKDFRVALVQMDSQRDKEENLRKMEERTSEAAQHGAALVVFPETVEYIGPDMAGHAGLRCVDFESKLGGNFVRNAQSGSFLCCAIRRKRSIYGTK